jgi:stress response protein YsnF
MAQPVKGTVYRDFLPMGSGASVALPEGAWSVTYTSPLEHGGTNWDVYTLVSQQPDAKVPFLVVRQTATSGRWGSTNCLSNTPSQFLVNEHGTLNNQLLNKCSRAFAFNFDNWRTLNWANQSSKKWWSGPLEGTPEKLQASSQGVLQVEMTVQQFNGKMLRVDAFVLPPKGVGAGKFRDDFLADRKVPEHQLLSGWTSIYIESMQQSFFNKKPQPIMALAYPVNTAVQNVPPVWVASSSSASSSSESEALDKAHEQRTQEVLREMQMPARPSTRPPVSTVAASPVPARPLAAPTSPVFASPSGAVADNAAQLKLEQERKALDEEKRKMAQQLELMTQMLAKLQQENAAAVAAAKAIEQAAAAVKQPVRSNEPVTFANRKALVIGNDLYKHVPKLNNAGADAEAMAKSLEAVGYKVFKHLNLDEKRFKQAVRDFRQNLNGGDEVLFFFAGHGVQLGNANYLLPTDVQGDHEDQVKDDAVLLQKVLDDLEEKKTKFTMAIIDACRDNPFKGKGRAIGGRGLAPTSAATGQMIMFSAGSGQQALDRLGDNDKDKNGLFTRIFVKEMLKPGLSVDRVLRNVRTEVVRLARSVGHEQTPALYDQAIGEFFFKQ